MNYPQQIEETSLTLIEAGRQLTELRERLAEMEAIFTLEILNARTPEGKPLYSNEAARSAELTLRMRRSEDVIELKRDAAQADEHRGRLLARLERLRGEFKLVLTERQAEIAALATLQVT